ncbi:MAG: hypothetical protein ACPLIG_07020 [Candidatus Bathyarchaeales archaeon]
MVRLLPDELGDGGAASGVVHVEPVGVARPAADFSAFHGENVAATLARVGIFGAAAAAEAASKGSPTRNPQLKRRRQQAL